MDIEFSEWLALHDIMESGLLPKVVINCKAGEIMHLLVSVCAFFPLFVSTAKIREIYFSGKSVRESQGISLELAAGNPEKCL